MTKPAPIAVLSEPAASAPSQLDGLRALQAQARHAEVLEQVVPLLAGRPEDRDLLLIEASALRHLRRTEESLAVLDRLAAAHPDYSLMHQERGLCHIARKDAPAAVEHLLRAVNVNPALPMSWRMLEGVYRLTGQDELAATAAAHVATLRALPAGVVMATALFADGDLDQAEACIRQFLLAHGDHPEAMRLLAKIGLAHQVYDDAEVLLAGVLAMVPDHRAARCEYVQALIHRQKFDAARAELAQLLEAEPNNIDYRTHASTIAVGLGEHEEAIALYRDLLAEFTAEGEAGNAEARALARADINLWLGHALKTVGRLPEAIEAYRAAAAARPAFGDAYWSLANLKTYNFSDDEIAAMQHVAEASETAPIDRIHLDFALGKAHEDRADYTEAWVRYARGNADKRSASNYRPEVIETNTREQRRVCTSAFFAAREDWGAADADPIFVVGLPRSGSTLIEQILASHSQVEGTQELPDIQRIVQDLQGREPDHDNPRYPGVLETLAPQAVRVLAETYLAGADPYRVAGRPFFIDKMPNNFRHIGLIHLILPHARIIDARREPTACCFSNLKQLFANGQEFSYSIEDIARCYRTYLDLMEHWDAALPGRVLRVIHEDLVDDPEGQIRRMLDHCGLPFEERCLAFHQTVRSVRTPSSEQVRRPISRDGLEQWRHFEPWLEPLGLALGDACERWRA